MFSTGYHVHHQQAGHHHGGSQRPIVSDGEPVDGRETWNQSEDTLHIKLKAVEPPGHPGGQSVKTSDLLEVLTAGLGSDPWPPATLTQPTSVAMQEVEPNADSVWTRSSPLFPNSGTPDGSPLLDLVGTTAAPQGTSGHKDTGEKRSYAGLHTDSVTENNYRVGILLMNSDFLHLAQQLRVFKNTF